MYKLFLLSVCLLNLSFVFTADIKQFPYPPVPQKQDTTTTSSSSSNKQQQQNDKSLIMEESSMKLFQEYNEMVKQCFESNEIHRTNPRDLKTVLYYNTTQDPIITVDQWIDEIDAKNVLHLASCIKKFVPQNHDYRPFDIGGYGGGNNVTFLNQFMQSIHPQVLDQIMSVAGAVTDTIGWRPHPRHLGIRCIELLEYETNGELLWHYDQESVLTISIALSNTSDYQGGQFVIENRTKRSLDGSVDVSNLITTTPNQYGGVLFDSEIAHAVKKVTHGNRVVLVLELWPFADGNFQDERLPLEAMKNRPILPKLLRVPTFLAASDREVLSTSLDMRDMIVLCAGMLIGLVLALFLLEAEDRIVARPSRPIQRATTSVPSSAASSPVKAVKKMDNTSPSPSPSPTNASSSPSAPTSPAKKSNSNSPAPNTNTSSKSPKKKSTDKKNE